MEIKLTDDEIKTLYVLLDEIWWKSVQRFGCSSKQSELLAKLFFKLEKQIEESEKSK